VAESAVEVEPVLSERQALDREFDDIWSGGVSYESRWQLCGRYLRPTRYQWSESDANRGDASMSDFLDITAMDASDTAGSFLLDGIASPARPWYLLGLPDRSEAATVEELEWLTTFRDIALDTKRRANFYPSLESCLTDDLDFGHGAFGIYPRDTKVIHCEDYAPGTYRLGDDDYGMANRFARRYTMTVAKLVETFGWDVVSAATRDAYKNRKRMEPVTVRHLIAPNVDAIERHPFSDRWAFKERYWEEKKGDERDPGSKWQPLRSGGYKRFPIVTARWKRASDNTYGTMWPGLQALAMVIRLFEMEMDGLNGLKKSVDPPLKAHPSMMNRVVSLRSKEITYYDALQGPDSIGPLHEINIPFEVLYAKQDQVRDAIRKAYRADKVLALLNDTRSQPLTAEQTRAILREKLQLLGPVLERKAPETLGPAIELVSGYLIDASVGAWMAGEDGIVPRPPQSILDRAARNGSLDVKVEYISEVAIAQRAVGLDNLEHFARFGAEFATITGDVSALDIIDKDDLMRRHSEMSGVNPTTVRDEDDVAALRAQRAQDQAIAQAVAAAPEVAGAVKDLSAARASEAELAASQGGPA